MSDNADIKWYVVQTYSGYEITVKVNPENTVENNGLQEIKNNKRRVVQRKLLPGYVMVKMNMTNETWYIVRNTRGVTGFVGAGNKPTPLSETDFASIFDTKPTTSIDIQVGDTVRILAGLFENFTGRVTAMDPATQTLSVVVPMLKRETAVDLAYDEVIREED